MTRYALTILTSLLALALTASAADAASPKLTVKIGTNQTYTRAQLQPGETVVCHYQRHTLSVTTPIGTTEAEGALWPLPGKTHKGLFVLGASVAPKNRYSVSCLRGGYHW
jgi:hypothetical protein